jgi:hypothetical protein
MPKREEKGQPGSIWLAAAVVTDQFRRSAPEETRDHTLWIHQFGVSIRIAGGWCVLSIYEEHTRWLQSSWPFPIAVAIGVHGHEQMSHKINSQPTCRTTYNVLVRFF